MPVRFDFTGALPLAASLQRLADSVEAAHAHRAGPRDVALAPDSLGGSVAETHRSYAADEDAQLGLCDDCRSTAQAWADAWMRAVDDHNDEMFTEAQIAAARINARRAALHRLDRIDNPDEIVPPPELATVVPPRPAPRPSRPSYDVGPSLARYVVTQEAVTIRPIYQDTP